MDKNTNQSSSGLKKAIALVAAAIAIASVYYGSYLPLQKSQAFINTLRNMDRMTTLDEVIRNFDQVFSISSPIGQEELIRHFANIAAQTVQQHGAQNPDLTRQIVQYLEEEYEPIISRGRGMSFTQNLFLLGAVNHAAFIQTKDPAYLERAISLFEEGRELSPDRPQFLYQLFGAYQIAGQKEKAIEVGERIIELWPNDENIKKGLEQLKGGTIS
ncbi:MAG: tetratricopeptide repeat protein [Anaplasmataceae bacterium]|nr:tetratricopeptide repeat protein [Anaplasmataceae bacterium]